MLDDLVDAQLPLLVGLDEASRLRAADRLADLVVLAQHYRHYGQGWIGRRELDRRAQSVVGVSSRPPNLS